MTAKQTISPEANVLEVRALQLRMLGRVWTKQDDWYLKKNYSLLSTAEIAEYLQRPPETIQSRAKRLGLEKTPVNRWTAAEVAYLEKHYPTGDMATLTQTLGRSTGAIRGMARRCGLQRQNIPWSFTDLQYLRKSYATRSSVEIGLKLRKAPGTIQRKASELKLRKKPNRLKKKRWTHAELEYLQTHRTTQSPLELARHLKRDPDAIHYKLGELGLWPKRKLWTEEELEYLRQQYSIQSMAKLAKHLSHSPHAIRTKARQLKLPPRLRRWTEEEKARLRKLYPVLKDSELEVAFQRTLNAIKHKAKLIGLSRTPLPRPWDETELRYLQEHFGRVNLEELSTHLKRPREAILARLRELFPIATRAAHFRQLVEEELTNFAPDGIDTPTLEQIHQKALQLCQAWMVHPQFTYMRFHSYQLSARAVVTEAYNQVTQAETIPYPADTDRLYQRRFHLRQKLNGVSDR